MRCTICLVLVTVLGTSMDTTMTIASGDAPRGADLKRSIGKPVTFKLAKPDKPLIILETIVNEAGPFRFVLDTGASGTIISPELAKKLGIQPNKDEPRKGAGAGGVVEVRGAMVKSFGVGETKLENLTVGIMDLAGLRKAIETEIDGIIGYNFLVKFRVTIDYPKQTVTFE
jgi:predicted aspartyl protease